MFVSTTMMRLVLLTCLNYIFVPLLTLHTQRNLVGYLIAVFISQVLSNVILAYYRKNRMLTSVDISIYQCSTAPKLPPSSTCQASFGSTLWAYFDRFKHIPNEHCTISWLWPFLVWWTNLLFMCCQRYNCTLKTYQLPIKLFTSGSLSSLVIGSLMISTVCILVVSAQLMVWKFKTNI